MKISAAALGLALVIGGARAALAGPCDQDLAAIDAAMAAARLSPEEMAQLRDMRAQAEKLCSAGNVEEATDVIAEAKSLLGME